MSSEMALALFKGITFGVGLCIFCFIINLIFKFFKAAGRGLNKLAQSPKSINQQLEKDNAEK